jgi:tetratricopeptide (TPR) repeat protein
MTNAETAELARDANVAGLDELASWTQSQLLAHVDSHRAALGQDGMVTTYEAWLSLHPEPEAYAARFNLACLKQAAGRVQEAEREYENVIAAQDLPEARHNLALLLDRSGRSDEARRHWKYVSTAPTSQARPELRQQALAAWLQRCRRDGPAAALCEALQANLEFDPTQADLRAELALLRPRGVAALPVSAVASSAATAADPVVFVLAVCFNEAAMLPFFLDHYIHYVGARKVVLHDGGSTDGSAAIAARYPEVEFVVSPSEKLDDRELMRIRNEEWKKYRHQCDWMIVGDVDEFLYHPQMREVLRGLKQQGVTLPMVEGFNIIAKAHPAHVPGRFLWQDCQTGLADPRYGNKNLIFDPAVDINYTLGCHGCQPTGPVRRSAGTVFRNLHMCMPSYRHVIDKSRRSAARLSDWNKQTNAGFHYKLNAEMTRAQYNAKFLAARNALEDWPRPAQQRQGQDTILDALLQFDLDACILEVGIAGGLGAPSVSGSTPFFAWYVHQFGGMLTTVDADARRLRHARHELERQGMMSERVQLVTPETLTLDAAKGGGVDLVYFNAGEHYGDASDRRHGQRRALLQFLDLQPRLAQVGVVALDESPAALAAAPDGGCFALLKPMLIGLGYAAEQHGDTTLFRRSV